MDKLAEQLPALITAAAQSNLGIMALLSVALSVLAYFFFASASEKVKVGIFVILFLGVVGFGTAMFQASAAAKAAPPPPTTDASRQPPADPVASLSEEARLLLKEAASDGAGVVTYVHYGMGSELTTNDKNLLGMEDHDPHTIASWEAALQELITQGLLTDPGPKGEIFRVTKKGYGVAERLSN